MRKLLNEMILEAKIGNDIIYENKVDASIICLLTKRFNPKQKYSKLSKQIFSDLNDLSGMVKQRNMKKKLFGKSIILNEKVREKRTNLLRASIIAGNDNKKMAHELSELTDQEVNTNKKPEDLMDDLQSLTPSLTTSNADGNLKNRIYNIIDYLCTNQLITQTQYHNYIKKHLL